MNAYKYCTFQRQGEQVPLACRLPACSFYSTPETHTSPSLPSQHFHVNLEHASDRLTTQKTRKPDAASPLIQQHAPKLVDSILEEQVLRYFSVLEGASTNYYYYVHFHNVRWMDG